METNDDEGVPMSKGTTLIKSAEWVVGWDANREGHVYLRDADVAFRGNQITHVGPASGIEAEHVVDGRGLMVMPGVVSIHAHPGLEPMGKGFFEDVATKHLWMSRLYEYIFLLWPDEESCLAATQVGLCELLKSGCTTVADLAFMWPGWFDTMVASGMRAYLCPMVRSGRWYTPDGRAVLYEWDEAESERQFDAGLEIIDAAEGHASGRLKGMLGPAQVDTCTADFFHKCRDAAERRNLQLHTHVSQGVVEFLEMVRRHGKTPIEWMHDIGVLGPNTIVGHAIFVDQHPWVNFHSRRDLDILAETGTTVAHCPRVFAQRGVLLHSFGAYRAAGINVAIGTDTYPLNMVEEMRLAGILSKVASGHVDLLRTEHVFEAATVGAARALHRDDIGRLAPGAKADIVLVDLAHPSIRPVRDPIKSLIYSGSADAVRDVYVDGRLVVSNGNVLTIDYADALDRLQVAQERALKGVPEHDWANRTADQIAPYAFPLAPS